MLETMWALGFFLTTLLIVYLISLFVEYREFLVYKKEFKKNGYYYVASPYWQTYCEAPKFRFADSILFSIFIAFCCQSLIIPVMFLGGGQINQGTNSWGVELASMQDGSATKGSFFLGSGYVDERPVYRYYAKVDDAYYYEQVSAGDSTVKYTDETPQKITTEQCGTLPWTVNVCGKKTYTFLVPDGTVKTDYSLDAK